MNAGRMEYVDLENKIDELLCNIETDPWMMSMMMGAMERLLVEEINDFNKDEIDHDLLMDIVCNSDEYKHKL